VVFGQGGWVNPGGGGSRQGSRVSFDAALTAWARVTRSLPTGVCWMARG